MSENHKEIAVRLGSVFAALAEHYLPAIDEALTTGVAVEGVHQSSFSATVTFKRDPRGMIAGVLKSKAPKIPTPAFEDVDFVLQRDQSGQLEFLFGGTIDELDAKAREEPALPDDDYSPGDNASAPE